MNHRLTDRPAWSLAPARLAAAFCLLLASGCAEKNLRPVAPGLAGAAPAASTFTPPVNPAPSVPAAASGTAPSAVSQPAPGSQQDLRAAYVRAQPTGPQRAGPEPAALTNPVRRVAYQAAEPESPTNTLREGSSLREDLPGPPGRRSVIQFPKKPGDESDRVQLISRNDRVWLTAQDVPIALILSMIAERHNLNIVSSAEVSQNISVTLSDVSLEDTLDAILGVNGYAWTRSNNILTVSDISSQNSTSPVTQGRQVRVYPLNFVSAKDVETVITGLLSPVGQVFSHETSPTDQRRTHEQIVVEDLPSYLRRIEDYLRQVDTPPKQVLVEAHVLQVSLKGDCRHGVNFQQLFKMDNTDLALAATGFASAAAPASFLRVDGGRLTGLIEALKTTTDAKTLASPKVAVLNGQEAHLQIGSKLGYLLTTTTMTSTLQSVNFLDVGVILKVTPLITDDGQILMKVMPQVSDGRINPNTNLPESNTTEVETNVMLADGEALVIGGLIKEGDSDVQNKIPFLGDIWLLGYIFKRRTVARERSEIIIMLVPRIVPDAPGCRALNPVEIERASTPLVLGPLNRVDRTEWEAEFPSCCHRPDSVPRPPVEHLQIQVPPAEGLSAPMAPEYEAEEVPAGPVLDGPASSRRTFDGGAGPSSYETPTGQAPDDDARGRPVADEVRRLPPTGPSVRFR